MRLWFECWGYNKYDMPPDAHYREGDYGIIRCSHEAHYHSDQATYELQHQRGPYWFDRVTDQRRVSQPTMCSGDVIVSCVGNDGIYNNPNFAIVNRVDERRVTLKTEKDVYFPEWITELKSSEAEWVVREMLKGTPQGFPRHEPEPLPDRMLEPKYEIEPVLNLDSMINLDRGVYIVDARTSAKPWQSKYMSRKIGENLERIIKSYRSTPIERNTMIWYIASGLDTDVMGQASSTVRQLVNQVANHLEDSFSLGKIDYRVWSSWEFAHHVRAYPDMMTHIVQNGLTNRNINVEFML